MQQSSHHSAPTAGKPVAGARKRIVFVDDEPGLLAGMQNLLRKDRQRWEVLLADGGGAALAILAGSPVDVIISDMRMPGMDGAELLTRVKEQFPGIVRIILSGHAEPESLLRALPVAHQFLVKPCDGTTLRNVIERACGFRDLLSDEALRSVVGKIGDLPSMPGIYWEMARMVGLENDSLTDVASVLERDVATTSKLLQLANSSHFNRGRSVNTVQEAIGFLGLDLVRNLILGAHAFSALHPPESVPGFSMEALMAHSVLTARVAQKILKQPGASAEAFTAGLLHDIGLLIALNALPEQFEAAAQATRRGRPQAEAELDFLGVEHTRLGGYLLGTWGLPRRIVEAVAHHDAPQSIAQPQFDVLTAVYVANVLVEPLLPSPLALTAHADLDMAYLKALNVDDQIESWRATAVQERAGL